MDNIGSKITGDQLTAAEYNSANDEQKNLVTDTGIALAGGDTAQFGKAVSHYAAGGDFYTDSGAADAYVCSAVGSKQAPTAYFDGMRVRFLAGADNAGASTVNVNALGLKDVVDYTGTALIGGEIVTADLIELIYNSGAGNFRIVASEKTNLPHVLIQTFTTVNDIGDSNQILGGHTITADSFITSANLISGYNLADNSDFSGNTNTLNDADAYNAANGILNVATTAHLGIVGQHLQADAITGHSGAGDLDISIGGWHNFAVSGGGVAFGTNAGAQKIQYYTDAGGYSICDVAGVTASSTVKISGSLCRVDLVYDSANSEATLYIDTSIDMVFACTTNLAIQASPSLWVNSLADGTLEVASTHDEVSVYEGVMDQYDIDLLGASKIAEPTILQGKRYFVKQFRQPLGKTTLEEQGLTNVVGKISNNLYTQAFQYDRSDLIAKYGEVI